MATSSRDRISVDLRGLKAALVDRAGTAGMSPSRWVRTTLAQALGQVDAGSSRRSGARTLRGADGRVRVHLRLSAGIAKLATDGARRAGVGLSDYVAGLVAHVPALCVGAGFAETAAALRLSTAELATLRRNLHRLSVLLRQADTEGARAYRQLLDTLASDIRRHLELAAAALAQLKPMRGTSDN